MNHHKNARLTFVRRLEVVQDMTTHGLTPGARKWPGRYLADASSRPAKSPRRISESTALAIVALRRRRLTEARIATRLGVSAATVSRVLQRAGLSRMPSLESAKPVQRYEHAAPGEMLHIDIKKLGRIERAGHRIHGDRRARVRTAGWEYLSVAVDNHARIAFTQMRPTERGECASAFLRDAVAYFQQLGVPIQRLLTDNGSAFRSNAFRSTVHQLQVTHKYTRAYRPQTNG